MRRRVVVIVGMATALAAAAFAQGQDRLSSKELKLIGEGRAVYLTYCTGCHGIDARGGLTTNSHQAAPDLALIAVRDGRFDTQHVTNQVDGRRVGCQREMPCWGKTLAFASNPGGKIMAVTRYLDFIQEPASGMPAER